MGLLDWFMPFNETVHASSADSYPVASPWTPDPSPLNQLTYESLYGFPAADTVAINRKTAMGIPAIKKARDLIATTVGRMPLVAEKAGLPLTVQPTFLGQLQTGVTNFNTLVQIADNLFFYGRCYVLIDARLTNGQPASLRVVPESEAEADDYGMLKKAFGNSVRAGNWFRIDGHNEGLLASSPDLIRAAKELERVAAEVGANPVPSIILKQAKGSSPMTKDQIDSLLARWNTKRRARYGSTALLTPELDAEQIGQAAENLLIEGRNYTTLEVARATGIPASFLEAAVAGASLTYTNQQAQNRQLLEAITPYMTTIEQTLSMLLPYGTKVEFDTAELLRSDTKDRYDTYKVAIDAGFLTINEARELENMKPLPKPKPAPAPAPAPAAPTIPQENTNGH